MIQDTIRKFHEAAASPRAQMEKYMAEGKKIVLTAPVYTPEEIIHSMGFVPMGAWGADMELNRAKEYFPAFLCSIVQSILELGINGAYKGASAIVIPSLCDTLKTLGENWNYAVDDIKFSPMTYPQNRKPDYGIAFTKAGYERVIRDLEELGGKFDPEALKESSKVYNAHNAVMRRVDEALAVHPEITAAERSDIFKSAYFMTKEEHTALCEEFLAELGEAGAEDKLGIVVSGILTDAPQLCLDFVKEVPTTWDETRYISGFPGETVVLARRNGDKWYVAAVNAVDTPLEFKVKDVMEALGVENAPVRLINGGNEPVESSVKASKKVSVAKNDAAILVIG